MLPTALSWMSQAAKGDMPGFPFQPLGLADHSGIELRLNQPLVWVWGAELGLFPGIFGSIFTLQPAEDQLFFFSGAVKGEQRTRKRKKKKGNGIWHLQGEQE